MSINLGQQARHERLDVASSTGQRGFSYILPFMPLQDDPSAKSGSVSGQPQVSVQDGASPPLKNQDGRTLMVKISQRLSQRRSPVPIYSIVDLNVIRVNRIRNSRADMVTARVKAPGEEAAHKQGAYRIFFSES